MPDGLRSDRRSRDPRRILVADEEDGEERRDLRAREGGRNAVSSPLPGEVAGAPVTVGGDEVEPQALPQDASESREHLVRCGGFVN